MTASQTKMTLKGYLIAGLLLWLPVTVTLWVLSLILGTLDSIINLLPKALQPEQLFGFPLPGLGVVITILLLLGTGMLAANVFGKRMIVMSDNLLSRIPVVKGIYKSVKQVSDTLLSDSGQAFRKALLVQFPHQGCWTVAFVTGKPAVQVLDHLGYGEEFLSVYVPTTPNPTSGYFVVVAKKDTRELTMSVDEALKYVISMGVVSPQLHQLPSTTVITETE